MVELSTDVVDGVAAGSLFSLFSALSFGKNVGEDLISGINAGGATLRNYYGDEMTLQIFAAGNMGA